MSALFFSPQDLPERSRGLTYSDVLIVPRHSSVTSRRDPELKTQLTTNYTINLPVVSANMDTVTESEMCMAMGSLGAAGILHRFLDIDKQVEEVKKVIQYYDENKISSPIMASIGVKDEDFLRAQALVDNGVQILTIDVAHGDSIMMYKMLEKIKSRYPKIDVIAGNTATPSGTRGLIDHGADAIKVGIGPGSMCTTRIITGCGVPQLTALALCVQEAKKSGVPVMADGGLKTSGDIVKALCCGVQSVMLGSMLSGTVETPGDLKNGKKRYRGMASRDAQKSWRGKMPKGMAPEGESTYVPCKGPVESIINEICGGIRSGMSYVNALNIPELNENALFVEVTHEGQKESGPHGLMRN